MQKKLLPQLKGEGPVKVGNIKEYITVSRGKDKKPGRQPVMWTYNDVEYDIDGWADSKKYLPIDFDLVHLRLKREKTIPGWVIGSSWNGLRLKKDDVVLFWKKKNELEGLLT